MFPFEHSGEISFQGPNHTEQHQQDLIPQNELLAAINRNNPSTASTAATAKGRGRARGCGRGHGRKSWLADIRAGAAGAVNEMGVNKENDTMKKMVHREIERQRRQEMSDLFSSLRSLLPPIYVKGKRSMSDHIAESISYITDLEKNIKELGVQRDKLKIVQDNKSGSGGSKRHGCNIAVYTSAVGVQVQIVTGLSEQRFALSTTLKVLNDEGLNVVSCVSNRANEGFFHNIQCQVNDMRCIDFDIERLQQRLYEAVC